MIADMILKLCQAQKEICTMFSVPLSNTPTKHRSCLTVVKKWVAESDSAGSFKDPWLESYVNARIWVPSHSRNWAMRLLLSA